VALARRFGQRLGSFHVRQGIANLHRPGNQTRSVIVAVGMGFVLLGTLLILQQSLRQLLALEQRTELPNLFIIDIQPDQRAGVQQLLEQHAASGLELSPMVSARIGKINRQAADLRDALSDAGEQPPPSRQRTREYFLSYRAAPVTAETVTAGRFWFGRPEEQEASIDEDLAQSLNIALGDTLTLDIQGIPLDAKVTSFRDIRWQALRPNAMILLSPGEIEAAPKMFVASARVLKARGREAVQQALVERFPNLTVVDAAEAAQTVLLILSRISSVFAVLGLLAVITGAIIVGGAIAAGRFARQREAMLFKVLGASRRDLQRILLSEYTSLALFGIVSGWLLCEAINRAAIPLLFEAEVSVPYGSLIALAAFALLLNTGVGVFVGQRTSQRTALSVLRED
jgi:putative ABC transport system permease protein